MKKTKILIFCIFFSFLLPMVIFTIPVKAEETSLQDIIAAGEIHIGTNAEYAPFSWMKEKLFIQEIQNKCLIILRMNV